MSLAAVYGWKVVVGGIKELVSRELTYPDMSPTKALFEVLPRLDMLIPWRVLYKNRMCKVAGSSQN